MPQLEEIIIGPIVFCLFWLVVVGGSTVCIRTLIVVVPKILRIPGKIFRFAFGLRENVPKAVPEKTREEMSLELLESLNAERAILEAGELDEDERPVAEMEIKQKYLRKLREVLK